MGVNPSMTWIPNAIFARKLSQFYWTAKRNCPNTNTSNFRVRLKLALLASMKRIQSMRKISKSLLMRKYGRHFILKMEIQYGFQINSCSNNIVPDYMKFQVLEKNVIISRQVFLEYFNMYYTCQGLPIIPGQTTSTLGIFFIFNLYWPFAA